MRAKSERLTDRQKAIIKFIERHVTQHGFPPTIREIGEATGIERGVQGALHREGRAARDLDERVGGALLPRVKAVGQRVTANGQEDQGWLGLALVAVGQFEGNFGQVADHLAEAPHRIRSSVDPVPKTSLGTVA